MPRATSTATPSIVSLTVSGALTRDLCGRLGSDPGSCFGAQSYELRCGRTGRVQRHGRRDVVERRRVAERAAAFVDVRLELAAELVHVARHCDRSRLAERAEALAVDPVAHVEQQVELRLDRFARFEPAQDLGHPACPLTARRALAAGLVLVELRDADAELHHAAAVVECDDAG